MGERRDTRASEIIDNSVRPERRARRTATSEPPRAARSTGEGTSGSAIPPPARTERASFRAAAVVALAVAACGGVQRRFPDDVQSALAHDDMRRLETERFIIYYPAHRRAEVDRFLVRADRCAAAVRGAAQIQSGAWHDKMVIAMPETAFNNAFVSPELLGYEHVAVIPTVASLDLTTEFGLLPDPGITACHELVHYVHLEQIAGFWHTLDVLFGHVYTPQVGADSWFLEGLATHYEASLSPGVGRPTWPIFTGMFAAGYAGQHITGGDLSVYARRSPVGHNYLVGAMFVYYLSARYGEPALWAAIASQAHQITGWFFPGTFDDGVGKSLGDLIDEFDDWHAHVFPVRQRPAGQRRLQALGNDARYARGRDGTEAWVTSDVDQPPRLIVRDPDGTTAAELRLLDVLPPRTLVDASPLLVSGLSVTADGREVWLTMIDRGATAHVPRLLRWRRDDGALTEITDTLGPGATIDPSGAVYYYCAIDGDRWSLAAWDVARRTRRVVVDAAPGTYVLGAQVSPDGARLVASVWNGRAFVAWLIDAASGERLAEITGPGTPIWDASFTGDGRVMYLGVIDGRFQLMIDGRAVTDAPYTLLAARSARGTIRFLNRDGWAWTLDEINEPVAAAAPAAPPGGVNAAGAEPPVAAPRAAAGSPVTPAAAAAGTAGAAPPAAAPRAAADSPAAPAVLSDQPYSAWEHLFVPQLHAPVLLGISNRQPHLGLVLGGGDRLGLQRWSLAGYAQVPGKGNDTLHAGGELDYLNMMLAPWQILATARLADWVDQVEISGTNRTRSEEHRTREATLSIARTWRDSLTGWVSAIYARDIEQQPGSADTDRELGGGGGGVSWVSGDATPYTGLRLALYTSAGAMYYPRALSSLRGDVTDTRGELGVVLPLPLGARHTLTIDLRGRALIAGDDTGLVRVGGSAAREVLWNGRSVAARPPAFDDARFPLDLRFSEYLRGYEDYAITTDRAAIASATWRYPLIIDRGVAATFGWFPASFLRQLDVELFATGAVDRQRARHAALGGELIARFELVRVPLVLGYQLARRVRDDDALTQLLEIAIAL